MSEPKWMEAEGYLIIVLPGKEPKTIKKSSEKLYADVKKGIKASDNKFLLGLLFPEDKIEKKTKGKVKMDSKGTTEINGEVVDTALSKMVHDLTEQDLPIDPLLKLQKNIAENKNQWIREQIFRFLTKNKVSLTDDGCFICYKGVRERGKDLVDCHSGSFKNNVGCVVRMPKSQVDLNPHETCSTGLHVAAHDYVRGIYGGGVHIAVKVHPKDVCSVPYDYQDQKMRTCEYTVVALMNEKSEMEHLYFPWDKTKISKYTGKPKGRIKEKLELVDFNKVPAPMAIAFVLSMTKKIIPVSEKSKSSVIKYALKYLDEEGYKISGTCAKVPILPLVDCAKREISIEGLTAPEIVAKVEATTKEKIVFNLKSKTSIVAAAIKLFAERGYKTIV